MKCIIKRIFLFKIKEIYFAERPFDVDDCDSVTFFDCTENVEIPGFTCAKKFTAIIDLNQDLEVIFSNFGKHNRQKIRRAEKEGIRIRLNQHYNEFKELANKFQKRKGFGTVVDRITADKEWIKKYGTLFTAEYNGEVLCGVLFLEDEYAMKAWIYGSKRLDVAKEKTYEIGRANRLLHWESIKYAKEKGLKEWDWGGMWSEEEVLQDDRKKAINDFKSGFGSNMVARFEYKKVYSKYYKVAQALYRTLNNILLKNTG